MTNRNLFIIIIALSCCLAAAFTPRQSGSTIVHPQDDCLDQVEVVKSSLAKNVVHKPRPAAVQSYIDRFHKVAVQEQAKFGIPASIKLAQGIVESGNGSSRLAANHNNHFGMKCFSKKCGPGHCVNFKDDSHKDFFVSYSTAWESWRAHSRLLSSSHYSDLKKLGNDYKAWAKGLKKKGYATAKDYDTKLIKVIEDYRLHEFDHL